MSETKCKHDELTAVVSFYDEVRGKAYLILYCDNCESQIIMTQTLPGVEP